jgi:hypothetical protein
MTPATPAGAARRILAAAMPERTLQENVRRMALAFRWRYFHVHRSQHSPAGFPDVIAVRDGVLLAFELKRQDKEPAPDQAAWLADLAAVPGVTAGLWKPMDWISGEIERVLRGDADA